MIQNHPLRGRRARSPLAAAVAVALLAAPAAHAIEFQRGELSGSFDTTVSYGYSWRVQKQDPNLLAKAYHDPLVFALNLPTGVPGSSAQVDALGRFSANRDDGNVKYNSGDAISNAFKITSELSLNWRSWGAFTRATYFYDFENADRNDLTVTARKKVGEDFRLLDAFVFKNFELGEDGAYSGNLRLGRQAVSWGEGTFIQGGINVINPFDVSKLRVAGAELKEAFLPIDMVWGTINLSETVALEALYMFEFEEVEADPAGTYFSSNDFATAGGTYVMLGFGTAPQPVNNPELFWSTCFGGGASDVDIVNASATARGVACGNAVPRAANRPVSDSGQYGLALRWYAQELGETEFGFYFLNYHSRLPLLSGTATNITLAELAARRSPGHFANYFVEYPEDIRLYGMSWNTTLPGGVAWQGEVSYRPNMPLQFDDVELLFAALSPLNAVLPQPALRFYSQMGDFGPGEYVKGWDRHKVSQIQMTFTKLFSDVFGASGVALVGEVGATEVWDLPSHDVLRYEGEGTDTGGGCAAPVGCLRNPYELTNGFPTQFSWGYRLAARADYNSVWGTAFNVSPRIAFNHDVNGITPGPGGNFLEGRKSLTLGVEANYQNAWAFDLSYTAFSGAKDLNQIHDRDFASFTVKYSF